MLEVENLKVWFDGGDRPARAVDGVSFRIDPGQTVALVGESGCGKSVTALALARLLDTPPARYVAGSVRFQGASVLDMDDARLRSLRGAGMAYVFQDPSTALNPVLTIGAQIRESIRRHRPGVEPGPEVLRLLDLAGMPEAAGRVRSYPHELSGGQRQRVAIAMALASQPRLLVADEPTTALDVTVQAQILERLQQIQSETGMAVLLITHNLGLVAGLADWLHVMYAGRLVESGPADVVLSRPAHPYTRGLLDAVPRVHGDNRGRLLSGIPGRVPHPARLPPGCVFAPRCSRRAADCMTSEPELSSDIHAVRCRYPLPPAGAIAHDVAPAMKG